MSQKSGNNLAESSVYALQGWKQGISLAVLIWRFKWGRIHFLVHSHCWQDLFPCDYMTEGPKFCWLLLGDYSQRPEASHSFLYLGSSDMIVYFIKFTRSFVSSNLLRPSLMYHNAIIGLMYPHFGHVLFVKSKS